MPKSKYVTITLTQHEAELVCDEIGMACIDSNDDNKRRADLGRAHDKLTAAYACGHNKAPPPSLVARLAKSLGEILKIDGDQCGESQNIPAGVRIKAEKLLATVLGKEGALA